MAAGISVEPPTGIPVTHTYGITRSPEGAMPLDGMATQRDNEVNLKTEVGECGHAKPRKGSYQLYGIHRSSNGTRALAGPRQHGDS